MGDLVRAADIADTSSICPWNPDMFGVDMAQAGRAGLLRFRLRAVRDLGRGLRQGGRPRRPYHEQKREIEAIRTAIDKTGRPIVFSISPGDTPLAGGRIT